MDWNDSKILRRIEQELGYKRYYLTRLWNRHKYRWSSRALFIEGWHELSLGRNGTWALSKYNQMVLKI